MAPPGICTLRALLAEIGRRLVPHVHLGIGRGAMAAGMLISPALVISRIELGKLRNHDLAVAVDNGMLTTQSVYLDDPPLQATRNHPAQLSLTCCLSAC